MDRAIDAAAMYFKTTNARLSRSFIALASPSLEFRLRPKGLPLTERVKV